MQSLESTDQNDRRTIFLVDSFILFHSHPADQDQVSSPVDWPSQPIFLYTSGSFH